MNNELETNARPPQSMEALEARAKLRYGSKVGFQLGLWRLIIATNVMGIVLAVILATRGLAIAYAISIGVLCGFFLPGIVLFVICLIELKEYYFGRKKIPLASELRKPKPVVSPFDD